MPLHTPTLLPLLQQRSHRPCLAALSRPHSSTNPLCPDRTVSRITLAHGVRVAEQGGDHEHAGCAVACVETSPFDNSVFLVTDKRNRLTVWRCDFDTLECSQLAGFSATAALARGGGGSRSNARALARFSPTSPTVVALTAVGNTTLLLYNFATGVVERAIDGGGAISAIEVGADAAGRAFALLGSGSSVLRVGLGEGDEANRVARVSSGHAGAIFAIAVSPSGIALTASDCELTAWNLAA